MDMFTHISDNKRKHVLNLLALDPAVLKDACIRGGLPDLDRAARFMHDLTLLQVWLKDHGEVFAIDHPSPVAGEVSAGRKIRTSVLLERLLASSNATTAIGSVCANSNSARQYTHTGTMRSFYVGQVVILANDDRLRENWYVLLTELYPPSDSSTLLGKGVWLWGQEDLQHQPGCKQLTVSDREVLISTYFFEVSLENVLGVCRAYPEFLDPGNEEDVYYNTYFDEVNKHTHKLQKVGKAELPKVLLLLRGIALRAHPVSSRFYY